MLDAINWHSFLFLLFAGLTCGFAIGVLLSTSIVRMAFYLIVSLASTAGLFFLAGAKFVGAMQVMIYVGGTLVLLIFGVMLTAKAAFVSMKTRSSDWVLASIIGASLFTLLAVTAISVDEWRVPRADQNSLSIIEGESATSLGWGLIGIRVDKAHQTDPVLRSGMSGYLLPFEIVSVHLLVVLIGAAYLARTKTIVSYGTPQPSTFTMPYSQLYFSFHGRIPRHAYWFHGVIVLNVVLAIVMAPLAFGIVDESLDRPPLFAVLLAVFGSLLVLWPALAIRAKRWHDRGTSTVWLLLPLLPVIGAIWELVELGFLRGTIGSNRHGSDPLQ